MAAAHDVESLLARFGTAGKLRIARTDAASLRALALSWPDLDAILPDGGLPRGVVELAAPLALGGSTSVALAAICAGQTRGTRAWCAWLDPEGTLYAPGVVAAGVELSRMLVVRPPRAQLGRVSVKVVATGAFEVVAVDLDGVPGAGISVNVGTHQRQKEQKPSKARRAWVPEVLVRKLALAAEPSGSTVLLLTDASKPRAVPWPVALRLELSSPSPCELVVRVAKDKRGRIGLAKTIPFRPILKDAI
ncbi:MAG: recombinase A [Myxococcota bacterium]|nr:recombinase A [Myxococcota bacterium]